MAGRLVWRHDRHHRREIRRSGSDQLTLYRAPTRRTAVRISRIPGQSLRSVARASGSIRGKDPRPDRLHLVRPAVDLDDGTTSIDIQSDGSKAGKGIEQIAAVTEDDLRSRLAGTPSRHGQNRPE